MKGFSVFLHLSLLFLLAAHLDAQTFQNPQHIATGQDPISVFTVDVNGDGIPDLLYETEGHIPTPSSMNVSFGQSSGGFIAGPTLNLPEYVGGCRPLDAADRDTMPTTIKAISTICGSSILPPENGRGSTEVRPYPRLPAASRAYTELWECRRQATSPEAARTL